MLEVGIVGLPNSGKSTLFNALLKRQIAQVAEYPYTTIEPNVGVVEVPDERLDKIAEIAKISKKVPAAVKFIDIAGLIRGAHKGEGLGNQFLAHIREVDAILHVVRAFENPKVPHVHGKIDPKEDAEVVNLELELGEIKKPTIYVLNVSESEIKNPPIQLINQLYGNVIAVSAKLEAELSELSREEQKAYLKELGVDPSAGSGLDQVVLSAYKLLDLITFFTIAGGKSSSAEATARPRQAQAWPLRRGETALRASSLVHSDFEKGFINCEVLTFADLLKVESWSKAKEEGLVKTEGKDYKVGDGDILEFHSKV